MKATKYSEQDGMHSLEFPDGTTITAKSWALSLLKGCDIEISNPYTLHVNVPNHFIAIDQGASSTANVPSKIELDIRIKHE